VNEVTIPVGHQLQRVVVVPAGAPWPFKPSPFDEPAPPPPPVVVSHDPALSDRELIENALARIETALQSRVDARQQKLDEWRRAALDLAMAAMGMVVHRQLEAGQFHLDEIIRDMIASCSSGAEIHVHLNPTDARLMRDKLFGRPLLPDRPGEVQITEDASLARGDCRVDDGHQVFLSQLGERLREIREELHRSLGHVPA
jgi:flagellar biosynthesis/type III secretory pathway protein FliH